MGSQYKVILPLIAIAAVMLVSGCTSPQTPVKDLSPEDVAVNFWNNIDIGNYQQAFQLAYHTDVNNSQKDWVDERTARWGTDGGNIRIYRFKVVDTYDENSSMFDVGGACSEGRRRERDHRIYGPEHDRAAQGNFDKHHRRLEDLRQLLSSLSEITLLSFYTTRCSSRAV